MSRGSSSRGCEAIAGVIDVKFRCDGFPASCMSCMMTSPSSSLMIDLGRGVVVVLVRTVDTFRSGVLVNGVLLLALRGTLFLCDLVPLLVRWGP